MRCKHEYKEFRKLLREGIGTRSKKEFAAACDITPEHLSRLLNNLYIGQPSLSTLARMAENMDDVTFEMLKYACGYMYEPSCNLSINARIQRVIREITECVQKMHANFEYFEHWSVVGKQLSKMVSEDIRVEPEDFWDYDGDKYPGVEGCGLCAVSWHAGNVDIQSHFVLYYVGATEENPKLYPIAVSFAGRDFITSPDVQELLSTESECVFSYDVSKGLMFTDIESVVEYFLKYEIDIASLSDVTVQCKNVALWNQQWLEDTLGIGREYHTVQHNFGFYVPKSISQDEMLEFLNHHEQTLLSLCKSDDERQVTQTLCHRVYAGEPFYQVFQDYGCKCSSATGYGAVISNVMSAETGLDIGYIQVDDDDKLCDESCEWQDCIVFMDDRALTDEEVKMFYGYAKEVYASYLEECYYPMTIYEDVNARIAVDFDE